MKNDWARYWARNTPLFDWYKQHIGYQRMARRIPGQRLLEVGCGHAFVSKLLKRRGRGVITSDNDPEVHPDQVFDTMSIPYRDNWFDTVFSVGLMEHFCDGDFRRALKEQGRVGQRVCIFMPEASPIWKWSWNIRGNTILHVERTKDRSNELAREAGFSPMSETMRFGILFPYLFMICHKEGWDEGRFKNYEQLYSEAA